MYYDSELIYIQSQATAQARIDAIELIIDSMMAQGIVSAGTSNMSEYMLNDGQSIIKTVYRSPILIATTIEALERLKAIYARRINNPVVRLVDAKNLYPGRRC